MAVEHHFKRILVTGASGFVGRHFIDAAERGSGIRIETMDSGTDLRDPDAVAARVRTATPDAILHLAAQSSVPRSFEDPAGTLSVNFTGTLNLLQALQAAEFKGRLLFVSSGDIYGHVAEDNLPVREDAPPPRPLNPYALSKVCAEALCLQWRRAHGLDVVIARPFNHIGPGQGEGFVLPSVAVQLARAPRGQDVITLLMGDVDTTRDFCDVRDVVEAYLALLARGRAGETYLIGSGVERRVRDLIAEMACLAGVGVRIERDPGKFRPADQRRMVACIDKIRDHTGWFPRRPMLETLADILEYAKEKNLNVE
ncbi:NAD-dependent dehydratase [Lysobacter oculi]|uniref:NAD-dependent dehydratase n=1 Tax=Solilutibacter oculi TaxID=2698682 RepID=A0A344J6S0_9GAMM|nr:GDP-mannose 4,6-dehydratase [Lysobacter oculi]AXA84730.1 NAD-dependent dehydratase [Lysobacter oculi]